MSFDSVNRTWVGTRTASGPSLLVEKKPRSSLFTASVLWLPLGVSSFFPGSIKSSLPRLRILTCPITRLLLLFLGTAARGGGDELGLRFRRLGCARFGRGLLRLGFRVNLIRCGCDCKGFFRQSWGFTTRTPMLFFKKQIEKTRFLSNKIKETYRNRGRKETLRWS